MLYYDKSITATLNDLKTSRSGLQPGEVKRRQNLYGPNVTKLKDVPLWRKLIEPFKDVFMIVLFIAAVISIWHGDTLDAVIILVIMASSIIIYYIQRFSTERILRSLQRFSAQMVEVIRGDQVVEVDSSELVPGDIVILTEGERIPADARLIEGSDVRVDESLLTGESTSINKQTKPLNGKKEVYEQSNILFQGSFIVSGKAIVVVTSTGNNTEFGQIAALAQSVDTESPVQQKINKLLKQLVIIIACIAVFAFILALVRGTELTEALRFVMALSVSAVPEGLPIAISIILALGIRRMAAKKALVRNMRSIETIGVITTIATDKTGTLTKNKLTVQETWQPAESIANLIDIIKYSVNRTAKKIHDPLDIAMIDYIKTKKAAEPNSAPEADLPFSQSFAMSGNVWKHKDKYMLAVKGAPEQILQISSLTKSQKGTAEQTLNDLTSQGFRVVALASKELAKPIDSFKDLPEKTRLDFSGFIAVADILRPEAKRSIAAATAANVTVRMITGDHFETAYHIGKELGMVQSRSQVFDSRRMNNMNDEELAQAIRDIRVFSRVIPENKYRILSLLKQYDITAMTGDGVNDVPALTNAHIGISMGSGAQIAKDAGDIILLDDNFKSIIDAMKEGRIIFANIRRMLYYLLATNTGEVITILGSLILGLPIPLAPVQILWINLATDTALVIPLGLEPGEKDIMKQKPKSPNAPILNKYIISRMILVAISMAAVTIPLYVIFSNRYGHAYGQTIAFSALVIIQWANAFNARSDSQSMFGRLKAINTKFYVGLAIAVVLQTLAIFGPLQSILHLTPVAIGDLILTGIIAFTVPIVIVEIHKYLGRRFNKTV